MEADTAMDERGRLNWTTLLHEQTHLKPHEWWQRDGKVTKRAKVHAFISLIYLTSVVFHPGPCHRKGKHTFDQLKRRRKFVYLCKCACVSKNLSRLRGRLMYAIYTQCHIDAATQGSITRLRILDLLCMQHNKELNEFQLKWLMVSSRIYKETYSIIFTCMALLFSFKPNFQLTLCQL